MDLSLLVHTCDSYERFWPGMLFSLDFNWDFNSVPVYWASEDINIHNHKFGCKHVPYFPNKTIVPIITGKTDRNGFSTRMRIALEEISTKWVIYIQEDMWLISNLSDKILSDLVSFCDVNNVSSLKIHTKLNYYESYRLEKTNFRINGMNLLKYSDGENYLHSHNATIWNRQYLLEHLVDGEDPWTNEIQGSKRMSSYNNNHYHYNIHWYSQPGVCENGGESRDFFTLAPILDDRMYLKLTYNL